MSVAWGDVATWVSGSATAAAVWFAAMQVRQLKAQAKKDRRVELDGVAVSWRAPKVPSSPERVGDAHDNAEWTYVFTAHNPGRLPITGVRVVVTFPMDVRRRHFDGHIGEPTRTLRLVTPVMAGGDRREWKRNLILSYALRNDLEKTFAVISFRDPDGEQRSNRWAADVAGPSGEE